MESAKVHDEIIRDIVPIKETETIKTVERVDHETVPIEETEVVTVESDKVDHEIVPIETTTVESGKINHDIVPFEETETVMKTEIIATEETDIVTALSGKVDHEIASVEETETVKTVESVHQEIAPIEETEVVTVESDKVDNEIVPIEKVTAESGKINHEIVAVEETETVAKTTTEKVHHEIVPIEEIEKVDHHEIVPIEETKIVNAESGKVNHEIVPVEETETIAKDTATKIATNVATNVTKTTWDIEKEKPEEKERKPSICGQITQVILRVLVFGCMAAACLIMLFKEQTVEIGGFRIRASYRVSPAFKFFLYGTGAVAIYSMISIPMVYCRYRAKSVHIFDTLMMALAIASASAATAVGYIAKFGNDEAGWSKSCDYYKAYCLQSTVSIGCAYVGFICLLIICIMSSNPPRSTRTK